MIKNFPGKILFFDDKEKDVHPHIRKFREDGYAVKFFSSLPDIEDIPSNVRLVITDLDLDGCGEVSDDDIELLITYLIRIENKTSFFLISIFSGYVGDNFDDHLEKIKEKYFERTGKKIQAEFLKPLKKSEFRKTLKNAIEDWIENNPHSSVIIEWEKIIEEAKDVAVSTIVNAGEIKQLLASMDRESSKEALPREVLQLFDRILLRYSCQTKNMDSLGTCIQTSLKSENPPDIGLPWYSNIHFLNNYYYVRDEEAFFTGDIYDTNDENLRKRYAIISTPMCDIAQNKLGRIKIIFGTSIDSIPHYSPDDTEDTIPTLVKIIGKNGKGRYYSRSDIIEKLTTKNDDLPKRFFLMHFIKLNQGKTDYVHLLFDFHNSDTFSYIPQYWNRICRVDSPQIDSFIQKYAVQSSRFGVNAIPDSILSSEKERIKSK